jgi:hypothetical protein
MTEDVKYTYEYKVELSEKINKIKKKEYLAKIFNIITSHNNNKYYSGKLVTILYIHDLPNKAYEELDEFLDFIYKK